VYFDVGSGVVCWVVGVSESVAKEYGDEVVVGRLYIALPPTCET